MPDVFQFCLNHNCKTRTSPFTINQSSWAVYLHGCGSPPGLRIGTMCPFYRWLDRSSLSLEKWMALLLIPWCPLRWWALESPSSSLSRFAVASGFPDHELLQMYGRISHFSCSPSTGQAAHVPSGRPAQLVKNNQWWHSNTLPGEGLNMQKSAQPLQKKWPLHPGTYGNACGKKTAPTLCLVGEKRVAEVSLIHCLPVRITPRSKPAIKSLRCMWKERNWIRRLHFHCIYSVWEIQWAGALVSAGDSLLLALNYCHNRSIISSLYCLK
jgi:hypothetical protein